MVCDGDAHQPPAAGGRRRDAVLSEPDRSPGGVRLSVAASPDAGPPQGPGAVDVPPGIPSGQLAGL